MQNVDPLYYPRTQLAETLLNNFQANISHAFTLFAPRRMGKTQFLKKDVTPVAEKLGFRVFYFSFMDTEMDFQQELFDFANNSSVEKAKSFLATVKNINVLGTGIEVEQKFHKESISQIIARLAEEEKPVLLLKYKNWLEPVVQKGLCAHSEQG